MSKSTTRRRARHATGIAAALGCAVAIAACGSSDDSSTSGGAADTGGGGDTRVGLALGGPRNDRGFYQSAYEGADAASKRDGFELSVVDSIEDPQQRLDAMRNLSTDNKLVIGGGAEFAEAAKNLAPQFPDVEYVVLTGVVDDSLPNLHAYVPRQGVPAYIAGKVAATLSETGHVGFVGGAEIPPTTASDIAFKQGAKEVDKGVKYSTTTIGTFNDPAKSKAAAKAQLAAGADSLFAFLDAGTPGVVQATEEAGGDKTLFAAIAPRCEESPEFVGTTVLVVSKLVEQLLQDWEKGTLPKGTEFYGVEQPDIQRFELCPEHAKDPKLAKLVETTTEELNAGKVKFPEGV